MERIRIEYDEKMLAGVHDEYETEWARISEIRLPWDNGYFATRRFFVVSHRAMDCEDCYWDRIYNDLRSALKRFGKEANRKRRCGGKTERVYGKIEYCDDWWIYRNELNIDHGEYVRSAAAGDYGPSNPWDAPGMSVRDFI